MAVDGTIWPHERALVLTVMPGGGPSAPAKLGEPPLVSVPLTATAIGAGVTVTEPGTSLKA